ncbi:MAG: hypothetical protein GY756_00740 [bacterium]|nr:hypothetical protein [bacterium]
MKNIYIILGNGFTLDFLNSIEKAELINARNLFENGEKVPWPGNNQSGFLSYKYCPNLWNLGARPNSNSNNTIELIEDIITCANILQKNNRNESNIYIRAYRELASYLNALFVYYDKQIDVPNINLEKWGWTSYLKKLNESSEVAKVHIVTFNYDIWLERVLQKLNINFDIDGFNDTNSKIRIYKPHGSISFVHRVKKVVDDFKIDYDSDANDGNISEFTIKYEGLDALNKINAIIPPAGDSSRLDFKWASEVRKSAIDKAKLLTANDEVIFCGMSYWHVDRLEIDTILTNITPDISNVRVINPNPPRVLNAVMTTLFKNVIFYNDSKSLSE